MRLASYTHREVRSGRWTVGRKALSATMGSDRSVNKERRAEGGSLTGQSCPDQFTWLATYVGDIFCQFHVARGQVAWLDVAWFVKRERETGRTGEADVSSDGASWIACLGELCGWGSPEIAEHPVSRRWADGLGCRAGYQQPAEANRLGWGPALKCGARLRIDLGGERKVGTG